MKHPFAMCQLLYQNLAADDNSRTGSTNPSHAHSVRPLSYGSLIFLYYSNCVPNYLSFVKEPHPAPESRPLICRMQDATRILREVKLLRQLKHPDIVEIKHIMLPPQAISCSQLRRASPPAVHSAPRNAYSSLRASALLVRCSALTVQVY